MLSETTRMEKLGEVMNGKQPRENGKEWENEKQPTVQNELMRLVQ